jgi:hypothetical protein
VRLPIVFTFSSEEQGTPIEGRTKEDDITSVISWGINPKSYFFRAPSNRIRYLTPGFPPTSPAISVVTEIKMQTQLMEQIFATSRILHGHEDLSYISEEKTAKFRFHCTAPFRNK